MPLVAAAILKSFLNSADTLKLRSTGLAGSGLPRFDRVSLLLGGSPLLLFFLGGGGVFVAIISTQFLLLAISLKC